MMNHCTQGQCLEAVITRVYMTTYWQRLFAQLYAYLCMVIYMLALSWFTRDRWCQQQHNMLVLIPVFVLAHTCIIYNNIMKTRFPVILSCYRFTHLHCHWLIWLPENMIFSNFYWLFNASLILFAGEAHFNAYQKPLLYFQVLFLTGQFEAVSVIKLVD